MSENNNESVMSDTYIVPRVEYTENGVHKVSDPYSYLLNHRVVYLPASVNELSANAIVAQFLALERQDSNKDIDFYINSGGGSVTAGLAIYDAMNSIAPKVNTVCIGQCCSMGAFLLNAGTGKRVAAPTSRIMIHQTLGGAQGQNSDIQIQAKESSRLNNLLMEIMAKNTGKSVEEMHAACNRDNFMTPQEAMDFGLIDSILEPKHVRHL